MSISVSTRPHDTEPIVSAPSHPARPKPGASASGYPIVPRSDVPHRRSTLALIGALGCFAAACLLAGAAACIALGAPAPSGLGQSALIAAAAAGALALVGIGVTVALRERGLRQSEARAVGRIDRIRRELDGMGLTPRETAVAERILQHRCYQDIADEMGLSPRTVQFHASNIFRKAYVTRRRDFERLLLAEPAEGGPEGDTYECIRRIRPRL